MSDLSHTLLTTFLADRLPNGDSTLVLADDQLHGDYLTALRAQLPELVTHQKLGTIGVSLPVAANPFLWAYADGSLETLLGSRQAARDCLRDLLHSTGGRNHARYYGQLTEYLCDALEQGVRVVAYGAAKPYRFEPPMQETFETLVSPTQDAAYARRYKAMERLYESAAEMGVGEDARSALLLAAASTPGHSRLVVSPIARVDGVGARGINGLPSVEGTFPDHLVAIMKHQGVAAPKVTRAVVACTALADALAGRQDGIAASGRRSRVETGAVPLFTVGDANVTHLPRLPQKAVRLEDKVAGGWFTGKQQRAVRVNPLARIELEDAAKEVTAAMGNPRAPTKEYVLTDEVKQMLGISGNGRGGRLS